MMIWIVFALMAGGAALAVLLPLWRGAVRTSGRPGAEIAVYRDQLAEIERDRARGMLGGAEADAAAAELARRIIVADRERQAAAPPAGGEAPPPGRPS